MSIYQQTLNQLQAAPKTWLVNGGASFIDSVVVRHYRSHKMWQVGHHPEMILALGVENSPR